MDQQKLRTLVFEKTGVKVDTDDPIFALVALNEAVLADTVERHVALIEAATQALLTQAAASAAAHAPPAWQRATAQPDPGAPAPCVPLVAAAPLSRPIPTQRARLFVRREMGLLGAAAGLSLLSALVVLAGQARWAQPATSPTVPVSAAPEAPTQALTAQQAAALRQGEKLARAVQKLDQKNRQLIEAEMNRP